MVIWADEILILLQKFGFNEEAALNITLLHEKLLQAKEETVVIENPEAKQLHFESLPSLKNYSSGDISEWPSLKKVTVNHCPNIRKFGLGRTKSVILKNQSSLGDIFESWDDWFSTIGEYEIDDTEELHKRMHNLRPLHFTNIVVFRAKNCDEMLTEFIYILMKRSKKLQVIEIQCCKTSGYLFDLLDRTLMDKEFKYLRGIKELKLIEVYHMFLLCSWYVPEYFDFKSLEIVHLKSCHSIKFLFDPQSFSTRLSELKELKLEACETLLQVVEYSEYSLSFPRLSKVELKSLSKFRMFSERDDFSSLKTLIIEECPCLEEFTINQAILVDFSGPKDKTLPELDELRLDGCHLLLYVASFKTPPEKMKLKKLFVSNCYALKMVIMVKEIPNSIELLPQLDELILINLPNLTHIIEKECVRLYQNLHTLQVERCGFLHWLPIPLTLINMKILDCDSLHKTVVIRKEKEEKEEVIFSQFIFSQLREVTLQNLRNLYTAFPFGSEFPSLEILKITNCPSLMTFVEEPKDLKEQAISRCFFPNSTVVIGEEKEEKEKVIFSQLREVTLQNLRNLYTAFPSGSEFPSLEILKITNCPSLMTFVEESNELKEHKEQAISRYFFPNSLSLEKLKVLHIIDQDIKELWHYSLSSESFCQIENLTLSNNNKLLSVISSKMIIRFNNMKDLTLDKCESLITIFILEDDHPMQEMLPQLRKISLSNLNSLKSIWNKEPIVPFLSNLVSLFIVHCDSIESLFSLSSFKYLKKLKLLRLYSCKELKQVISSDEDENVSITFPQMKCLVLKDLPKLVNFSHYHGTLNWPSLQTLRVNNVPSMKIFSRGNINTPLLTSIDITFIKKLWIKNLKETISFIYNNPELIKVTQIQKEEQLLQQNNNG